MFRKMFENVIAGNVKVLIGSKSIKLDNSYVHNLVHGFILAAEHLVEGGTAGQAYFINDGEPINMFRIRTAHRAGLPAARWPNVWVPGQVVHRAMLGWQWLHFKFGLPSPPLEPLAVERLYLDNYFSIGKAKRDLG